MLTELVREGMTKLAALPKGAWWIPDDLEYEKKSERAPIGLSELETCPRQLWFKQHGIPESNVTNPDMNMVWWLGSFMENIIVKSLEAAGLPVRGRQTEIYWADIPGHIDGKLHSDDHPRLLEEYGPGRKFLLELKSAKPRKIKELKRKGVRWAQPGYYTQMQAYVKAWELTFGERIDGVFFLAGNKAVDFVAGSSPEGFYEEFVPADTLDTEAQMDYLQNVIHQPEAPAIPFVKPDPLCNFCKWRSLCWRGTEYESDMETFRVGDYEEA